MAALVTPGERTPLIDCGQGTAIVFAHGMGFDSSLFAPQVENLSRDYRTVAYNLRAHSARGGDPYTLYDLVDDFTLLLDGLKIERCVLVGMSMGGYMAVRAALVAPERLYGVILIGASAIPFPAPDVELWRTEAELWRSRPELGSQQGQADARQNFSAHTMQHNPDLINLWAQRISGRSGATSYREFLCWAYQDDVREAFRHVTLPCLLVHGQQDAAVPLAHALETHALVPSARLLVLPYAGHAANLEYPQTVNEAIASFCAEVTISSMC